jgi:hypothetical protein
MSMITKRSLSRRTVLRGLGATIALPLLDGMIPALTAASKTAAKPVRRLGCIYVPNGVEMRMWTPKVEGAGYALSPILEPLKPFYDQTTVLSGLADRVAIPLPGEGIGDHARASSTWLTGVHVKKTEGPDIRAGVSMDQIAAQVLGKETQLASLELALDSVEVLGACDAGYSCAYANTISWRTPTTPLPMENDPRAVFERLFGASNSTDPSARLARIRQEKTILDVVTDEIGSLSRTLGSSDRQRLNEYLEAVRDVERRIQTAEAQHSRELPVLDQPQGIPDTFEKHIQLMYDLLAIAYQADLTRVGTFMISREVSSRSYPQIGVPDGHHACSHHQNDPVKLEKLAKINTYHVKHFTHFLEKLRNTPDGDGSLLDHSIFVYGSGISDGNIHFHLDLPMLLVGGGAGQFKGGRHIRYKNDLPLANLYVSVLDKLGVPTGQFGDSTGTLEYLTDI